MEIETRGIEIMSEKLTVIERNNLVELEEAIQKNLTAFYEVGNELMNMTKAERASLGIPHVEEILAMFKQMKGVGPCLTLCKR